MRKSFKFDPEIELAVLTEAISICPFDYYGQEAWDAWEQVAENVTKGFEKNRVTFEVPLKGCTARGRVRNQMTYFKSDNAKNLKK